ncbi:MAG: LysR family transcriptional regulator [Bdellovibrionota bacterium]
MSLLSPPLQAFEAIARLSTVQAASRELGITQTGVTQRIRSLEQGVGATLFLRSRKGMRLTSEGEALLRYCQASLELEGQALAAVQSAARTAEVQVRITGPTSILSTRIAGPTAAVVKDFPELLLSWDANDLENRLEELKTGRAHLAILPPHQVGRELDSKLLRPERYLLVATRRWKKRSLTEILRTERIIDFDPSDRMTRNYLERHRLPPGRPGRHFINNNEALGELFAQGLGYGVLTEEVAQPWLRRGQLIALNSAKVLENRLALAWYPRPEMPAYFRALVDAIH